jgi:serine/threonine protein kinase
VLSGLASAHAKGIVHRDLKPENIHLVETGTPLPGIKILDFGISRVVGAIVAEEGLTRITKTGTVIGTPEYMSPEHAAGQKDVDHRTDLYAMGVILYECLTGQLPFDGMSPAHTLSLIHSSEPVRPRKIVPDLSEKLESIVLRAMAKRRELRFQSAWEMFNALVPYVSEQALARVPIPEKPTSGLPIMVDPDGPTTTERSDAIGDEVTETEPMGGAMGMEDAPTEVDTLGPGGEDSFAEAATGVETRQRSRGWTVAFVIVLVLVSGGLVGLYIGFQNFMQNEASAESGERSPSVTQLRDEQPTEVPEKQSTAPPEVKALPEAGPVEEELPRKLYIHIDRLSWKARVRANNVEDLVMKRDRAEIRPHHKHIAIWIPDSNSIDPHIVVIDPSKAGEDGVLEITDLPLRLKRPRAGKKTAKSDQTEDGSTATKRNHYKSFYIDEKSKRPP